MTSVSWYLIFTKIKPACVHMEMCYPWRSSYELRETHSSVQCATFWFGTEPFTKFNFKCFFFHLPITTLKRHLGVMQSKHWLTQGINIFSGLLLVCNCSLSGYQKYLHTESQSPQSYLLLSWQLNTIPTIQAWTCYHQGQRRERVRWKEKL